MHTLPVGTYLQGGRYRIERLLGQGGFGITYLARHNELDNLMCVKEFFWKEHHVRQGDSSSISIATAGNSELAEKLCTKFKKEAKQIARLRHPNIITVHDLFDENGTAYYVMEYLENGSLADLLEQSGVLSEQKALSYISEVANALSYLHQNKINHLDIKPANILIDDRGKAVLIDFGVAKHYDVVGIETSTLVAGISKGYSPPEQLMPGGVSSFAPTADVYALGATLYKLITGQTPPDSMYIFNMGLPALPTYISASVRKAITQAMNPKIIERPQTIEAFMEIISDKPTSTIPLSEIVAQVDAEEDETIQLCNKTLSEDKLGSKELVPPSVNIEPELEFDVNGVKIKMVYVKPGRFMMGANDSGFTNTPAHEVTLTKGYYIGETPVTAELWNELSKVKSSAYRIKRPITSITHLAIQQFTNELSEKCGRKFRLPTEAEWEFAARGGVKSKGFRYSGSNDIDEVAWYEQNSGSTWYRSGAEQEVMQKQPNELGLYDMSGNVWELCQDGFKRYSETSVVDPIVGVEPNRDRVVRGGCYSSPAAHCTVSSRQYCTHSITFSHNEVGFRLAMDL